MLWYTPAGNGVAIETRPMTELFTAKFQYFWTAVLMIALFFPVRKMIWVMQVRRAIRKGGEEKVDAAEQERLKKRAGVSAALLCFVFSLAYVQVMLNR